MDYQLPIKLELPPDFLREEIRADYVVTEKTKKVWAVELDLLNELLRVCQKHDIAVYAFAGTLLGAVRHGGFIPWDDDVDVCLTRENFNKLLRVAKDEFHEPYFFQTGYNDQKFFLGYARLRNSQTTGIITYNKSAEYNNGLYVDIFVLDGLCEDEKKRKNQLAAMRFLAKVANVYHSSSKKLKVKLVKPLLHSTVKYEWVINLYHKLMSRYSNDAKRVSFLTHADSMIDKYSVQIDDLQGTEKLKYEFIDLPIPRNAEEILEHTYGDYMKFPPLEERGQWHQGILIQDPDRSYIDYLKDEPNENQETV